MNGKVRKEPPWRGCDGMGSLSWPSGERFDVCVIGAGIAGMSIAYRGACEGLSVLVIDDGKIGGGQTSCTSAHLSSTIDDRFCEVERLRGPTAARLAFESHAAAIDFIELTASHEQIECQFKRVDGYLVNPPGGDSGILDREEAAAREAGARVERVDRAPWLDFDTGPCLRFTRQAQFDPMKYLGGLARRFIERGGRVVTHAHVVEVAGGDDAHVTTRDHRVVRARSIVVATNVPINDRVIMPLKQAPYLTYVIAAEVARRYLPTALFWDTCDPYHYVRLVEDASDGHDLLIVGGEDHRTGQAKDHARRWMNLEQWTRERFPSAADVRFRWAGQVIETFDGLAYIGENPNDEKNVYIVTGDSGMGLTHGSIAGMLIVDLIMDRDNPWTTLYDPARFPPAGDIGGWVAEGFRSVTPYANWLTPGEIDSVATLSCGGGAVIRSGLRKLAVYRDEQGELHAYSATCPHLNAIVCWNDGEKTWDCPAHGSRFDCQGKVIIGPANGDLAVVSLEEAHVAK